MSRQYKPIVSGRKYMNRSYNNDDPVETDHVKESKPKDFILTLINLSNTNNSHMKT